MAFKINGFCAHNESSENDSPTQETATQSIPRKSVVRIRFPGKGMPLAYYNDLFDLKVGDMVYVDGKLEGQLGRVVEICYNFKIKISEYKKVIAVVDTNVHGQFLMAGSHFLTFDPSTLPASQVTPWFKAPAKRDDEYISSFDGASFRLDDLKTMDITSAIAERGHNYYMENRVRYLCIGGTHGYAIVEGSEAYEVEFEYHNGEISNLVCGCPCCYSCKHEFAAMLQLRETLDIIERHYAKEYASTEHFAAISKGTLFDFAINGKEIGSFTL